MRRLLVPLVAVAGLLAPASADAKLLHSGNFHLGDRAVGCRWEERTPPPPPVPIFNSDFTLRCERYADRTFIRVTRAGRVELSKTGRWVRPGKKLARVGWHRIFSSRTWHLFCFVHRWYDREANITAPALSCERTRRTTGRVREFTLGEYVAKVRNQPPP